MFLLQVIYHFEEVCKFEVTMWKELSRLEFKYKSYLLTF